MDRHLFHEANWSYQVIKKIEERKQFWHSLKDKKQQEIGNVRLSEDVSFKLYNLIDEIIKEHDAETERLYQIIEGLK